MAELKKEIPVVAGAVRRKDLLRTGLLPAVVKADYGFREKLVTHSDCSSKRIAAALVYIADAPAGYG